MNLKENKEKMYIRILWIKQMDNALIINGIESLLRLEHKCMKVKFALKIDISKRLQHFNC